MLNIEDVLINYRLRGCDLRLLRQLKSGKEATVYAVQLDSDVRALKVYVDPKYRAFHDNLAYFEGKYFRKPSVRKAVRKRSRFGKKHLHESWVRREFYMLKELHERGAHIPQAIEWTHESVLMEFVGSKLDLEPAPRLVDLKLSPSQASRAFEVILDDVELFLEFGIAHADLSAFNVLWWDEAPYIIDFPQAIDVRTNPRKEQILKRDLDNLIRYFSRLTTIDVVDVYTRFRISHPL